MRGTLRSSWLTKQGRVNLRIDDLCGFRISCRNLIVINYKKQTGEQKSRRVNKNPGGQRKPGGSDKTRRGIKFEVRYISLEELERL